MINRRGGVPTRDLMGLPGVQRAAIATALTVIGAIAPIAFDRSLASAEKAIHRNDAAESATRWTPFDDAMARVGPGTEIPPILIALGHYAVSARAVAENGDMEEIKQRLFYSHVYTQARQGSLDDRVAHVAFALVPEDGNCGGRCEREHRAAELITTWMPPDQGSAEALRLVLASAFFTARLVADAVWFNAAAFDAWLNAEYLHLNPGGAASPG